MGELQFEEEKYREGKRSIKTRSASGLAQQIMRIGITKNERNAQWILIGVIVVAVLIATTLFMGLDEEIDERYIFDPATAEPDIGDL